MNSHGNEALRVAIGEEETVFLRSRDAVIEFVRGGRRRGEILEGEQLLGESGIKHTERRILLHLEEDIEKSFFREEEEAETRGVRRRQVGGDMYAGDRDDYVAGAGESELLEEDHRPGVSFDLQRLDLGVGLMEEEEDQR